MKNLFSKLGQIALAFVAFFGIASTVGAQTISYTSQSATTTALVNAISSDIVTSTIYAIGVVLGVAVLMVAVGFAWRKFTSKVTGRKF